MTHRDVKEHKVDRKLGAFLHTAYDMRSKGDYDDFVHFSQEEVEELFQEMQEFIRAIERLVQEARESDERISNQSAVSMRPPAKTAGATAATAAESTATQAKTTVCQKLSADRE